MEAEQEQKLEQESQSSEKLILTASLEDLFSEYQVNEKQRNSLLYNLDLLDNVDRPTCLHSLRVGLKGANTAKYTHIIHPKGLLYPGLLHDIGKSRIRKELLKKNRGWTEDDSKEMENHVIYGFNILKDIHKFSAYVLLFHHRFHKGYPKILPEWPRDFSESVRSTIVYCGNILAIIDSHDAASTRKNDKFSPGVPRLLTREEVKASMLKQNPGQEYFIKNLYSEGIF